MIGFGSQEKSQRVIMKSLIKTTRVLVVILKNNCLPQVNLHLLQAELNLL